MALSSTSTVADALAQYNDNLDWQDSQDKAKLALAAVRFLLVNRPGSMSVAGRSLTLETLKEEKKNLEQFLGATQTRSNGRSRVNRADCLEPQGID